MKILEKNFDGKGSQKGFQFEQIKRTDKVALYKKTLNDLVYYEVFKIPYSKAGMIAGVSLSEGEYYPKDNGFGKVPFNAICTASLNRAEEYYAELTSKEEEPIINPETI